MHALGLEFGSAAQLSKRPGSVWNCLWGNALKRSPGIIRKSRVSYPIPGFLSSATWPLLPKKHYNGLNQAELAVALWGYACFPLDSRRLSRTFPPEFFIFLYKILLLMATYISCSGESYKYFLKIVMLYDRI